MATDHNFVQLAEAQLSQETLYCAGLDIHSFGGTGNPEADLEANMQVYGFQDGGEINTQSASFDFFTELVKMSRRVSRSQREKAGQ